MYFSITSSLVLVTLELLCIIFGPNSFTYTCLLCNVLLVRVQASGFWYTINIRPSLNLLLDILLLL